MIYCLDEKIICEGMTVWESAGRIGCQNEQLIFVKTADVCFMKMKVQKKVLLIFVRKLFKELQK